METRRKVKTIEVDYKCPNCDTGFLRPTGQVLTSFPAQYRHCCKAHII